MFFFSMQTIFAIIANGYHLFKGIKSEGIWGPITCNRVNVSSLEVILEDIFKDFQDLFNHNLQNISLVGGNDLTLKTSSEGPMNR